MDIIGCAAFLAALAASVNSLDLPPYLNACPANSPDFNACALKSAQEGIRGLLKGDKKYNIPTFNPFIVPLIEIQNNNLVIKLDNINIFGIDDAIVKDINISLANKNLSATVIMERLNLMGHYTADGKIASLPIQGNGDANITFVGGTYIYSTEWTTTVKNGEEYMKFRNPNLTYKLKRAYFYHGNLFNGNKELGDQVNRFLNENWELFLEDIGTAVQKTIESIATNIVTNICEKIPLKKIFP